MRTYLRVTVALSFAVALLSSATGVGASTQTVTLQIGVPSLEIPVGTTNFPITFTGDSTNMLLAPLPMEMRTSKGWKRVAWVPFPRRQAPKKALAGPSADMSIHLIRINTTRAGQQVRIGAGVLDRPITLTTTTSAVLPDLTPLATSLGTTYASVNSYECHGYTRHANTTIGEVVTLSDTGTPLTSGTSNLSDPGFCDSLPTNQIIRVRTPEQHTGTPDVVRLWRSAVSLTRQMRAVH